MSDAEKATGNAHGRDGGEAPATPHDSSARLAERYSVKPKVPKSWWVAIASVSIVLGIAVIAWIAVSTTENNINDRSLSVKILGPTQVEVTAEVTTNPGVAARCAVEALTNDYSVTGWTYVDFPAVAERTRNTTVMIRTQSEAVAASVSRCWIVE